MGRELPTGPQGCRRWAPTFHPMNIYKHLESGSESTKIRMFYRSLGEYFHLLGILVKHGELQTLSPRQNAEGRQLDFIHRYRAGGRSPAVTGSAALYGGGAR